MKQYVSLTLVAIAIMVVAILTFAKAPAKPAINNLSVSPSPMSVTTMPLDNPVAVQQAIDTEVSQIDQELQQINNANLDPSSLSNAQLGL